MKKEFVWQVYKINSYGGWGDFQRGETLGTFPSYEKAKSYCLKEHGASFNSSYPEIGISRYEKR